MNKIAGDRPTIGIVTGDPNGIGAEVVVNAWASKRLKPHCRPVIVGGSAIVEQALRVTGAPLRTRAVKDVSDLSDEDEIIDVIEHAPYSVANVRYGQDSLEAGVATGAWLDYTDQLARDGVLDGTVMGPISAKSLDMAGKLSSIASHKAQHPAYLVLRSGRLVIAHLTDHIPLREVTHAITQQSLYTLIEKFSNALSQWGVGTGRIAVAGFNPHAGGLEEDTEMSPAITQAKAKGLNIEGPVSPDSVFRQCIEGRYDAVIAMYHDQGHIALKTWGFSGNSVVFLGPPYVHTTVAHGVAYDLAGTGKADSSMILHAILDAAQLTAGKGFFSD